MNILFLSRWFPFPTNNGSKLRIYNLLRGLAERHDVTLLSFADQADVNPDAPEIQGICREVQVIPWREFDPSSARARFGFLGITPRSLVDTFSPAMARKISSLSKSNHYDLVIASQLSMASYRRYFQHLPALFEEVEVGLSHDEAHATSLSKRLRHAFTWFKLRFYLTKLLNSFQACTVVSEQEHDLLARHFSVDKLALRVIPNSINTKEYDVLESSVVPNRLIFTGSFRYRPNYEAMLWYVEEVHPYLLEEIPDAQLIITGDHADLPLPSYQNITLAGYVGDIKALISSSSASIVPLLSGGGTRLKILEAMALGTPVVSTVKGTEGLGVRSGEHLLVAENPREFARSVVRVLRDKDFGQRIAGNAKQFVRENYDWTVTMPKFLSLVEALIG